MSCDEKTLADEAELFARSAQTINPKKLLVRLATEILRLEKLNLNSISRQQVIDELLLA